MGSAITQGVGRVTGLQDKFSWAGVAAAGIGAGIGGAIGRGIEGKSFLGQTVSEGSFGHTLATSAAGGIANAATRSAIEGSSFGKSLIDAIPDIIGQALGSALGGALTQSRTDRLKTKYGPVSVSLADPYVIPPAAPIDLPQIDLDPVSADIGTVGEDFVASAADASAMDGESGGLGAGAGLDAVGMRSGRGLSLAGLPSGRDPLTSLDANDYRAAAAIVGSVSADPILSLVTKPTYLHTELAPFELRRATAEAIHANPDWTIDDVDTFLGGGGWKDRDVAEANFLNVRKTGAETFDFSISEYREVDWWDRSRAEFLGTPIGAMTSGYFGTLGGDPNVVKILENGAYSDWHSAGGWLGIATGLAGASKSLFRESVEIAAERAVPAIGGKLPNAGGVIRQFAQEGDQVYYRVFSGDSTVGSFLTAVPPRSSAFAREALALPPGNQATFIQEVLVPEGTLLLRSRALPQPAWDRLRGGAEQFELLGRKLINWLARCGGD